ncbi:hypothetical protein GP486_007549 [Trichoglossum hirsutum]|uniref:Uncharacterized protein n=1 Tax=Trichoglossum hirsutum TaxID=265104 RepID=A0A9P8ICJ4_9PEZI|nr:hypothetical protein GP486_007549 [Trichoglossum hirsutum]
MPVLSEGRRSMKLPDPPLFDGSTKDGVTIRTLRADICLHTPLVHMWSHIARTTKRRCHGCAPTGGRLWATQGPLVTVTYNNWLVQVENKLRSNADAYLTKDLKIIYVAGRVSGDAFTLISSCLRAMNWHAYETIDKLYGHLEELYGNPNKERNACQAFKDLTMKKKQTFQEFYLMFLRCVANRNISPRDLKDNLNDKLTWKLQEAVATYCNDPAITLSQFMKHYTTNDQ